MRKRRPINPVNIYFGNEKFFVDIEEDLKEGRIMLLVAGVHCCLTKEYIQIFTERREL